MNPFANKSILRLSSLLNYDWDALHRQTSRELADYPHATGASFFPNEKEVAYRRNGKISEDSVLFHLAQEGLENTGSSRKYLEYYKQLPVADEQIHLVSSRENDYLAMYDSPGVEQVDATRHLPRTYAFIRALPFQYVSRAIVWLGLPNNGIPEHCDLDEHDNPVSRGEGHFLLFDFAARKEFWVRDRSGLKDYARDPAIYFDTSRMHGSRPVPYRSYLIRVDGVFEKSFHEQVERIGRDSR
jgi:hypothetical protein